MIGGVLVQSETPQNEHRGTRPGQYRDVALQRNWYGRRWKNFGHAKKRQYLRRPLGPPSHRLDYGDLTPQAFPAKETPDPQEAITNCLRPDHADETEILRVVINTRRKKIERDPARPGYILTAPWLGCRFEPPGARLHKAHRQKS